MDKVSKGLFKLIIICAVCSFVYAVTTSVLEKAFWQYADHVSKGAIRIENELTRYKMKNIGQYANHLEMMFGTQNVAGKPITEMSWNEYRIEHGRKLSLELKIARAINAIVQSYLDVEL